MFASARTAWHWLVSDGVILVAADHPWTGRVLQAIGGDPSPRLPLFLVEGSHIVLVDPSPLTTLPGSAQRRNLGDVLNTASGEVYVHRSMLVIEHGAIVPNALPFDTKVVVREAVVAGLPSAVTTVVPDVRIHAGAEWWRMNVTGVGTGPGSTTSPTSTPASPGGVVPARSGQILLVCPDTNKYVSGCEGVMAPPVRCSIELEAGTPIADAVTRAREAFAQVRCSGSRCGLPAGRRAGRRDSTLWSALAADHVEGLRSLKRATLALRRCTEYLDEAGADHISLRLLRAGIRSFLGDHCGAGGDAAAIRIALGSQPHALTPDDSARLHRVEGLSAADRGDLGGAAGHLDAARRIFLEAGNQAGVAAVEFDRLLLEVQQGQEQAVFDVFSGEPPQTVSDYLLLASALRCQLRYEDASQVLLRGAVDHDLDPALRWHVLYDLILLLRLTRQDNVAQRLLPLLRAAAAASADPVAAAAAADRLCAAGAPSDALSPQFDRRVQHARRLILDTRLDEAGSLLGELHSHARTDRDISTWHLAAGELS